MKPTFRSVYLPIAVALAALAFAACSSSNKSPTPTTTSGAATAAPSATSTPKANVTTTASAAAAASPSPPASSLTLTSSAFADGGAIPVQYTCSGQGISPPLRWAGVPAGTSAFTLIVDDPDAPLPGGFTHWVVFDLSPDTTALPEGVTLPPQAVSGKNGAGTSQYLGPCPPAGAPHHYRFHLYALDTSLNLPPGSSKDDVVAAVAGHVLGEAVLVGVFQR